MKNKPTISIAMIVFNESEKIAKTLTAVKDIATEIIIIDSSSTDDTVQICKKFGAKIYNREWSGFVDQKNFALSKCSSDYILSLDADEELTQELREEILYKLNSQPEIDGFYLKRRTVYLGKLLKHSWQPDNRLRLIKKSASPKFSGGLVHEELQINSDKITILKNPLNHYSYKNINDHNLKTIRYAKLSADDYFARGRRASLLKLAFSPLINFIKMYIFRLGFLDGVEGLIAATSGYTYTFYKYAYLYELTKNEKRAI